MPRNRAWLIKLVNTARRRGDVPEEVRMPQASYDEAKAAMGGSIAMPPGAPEDTVFGTRIIVDDSLPADRIHVVVTRPSIIPVEEVA